MRHVRAQENTKLMEGEEIKDVFRAQGSVGSLDLILSLENDLREYENDVREKRCQPIKEVV